MPSVNLLLGNIWERGGQELVTAPGWVDREVEIR